MARAFFRLVATNPPTLADFLPRAQSRRVVPEDSAGQRRLWQGISAYATEAQARRKGRVSPALGRFVVRLEIDDDDPICWARTTSSSGHHTLWGDPAILLARVTAVVAVSTQRQTR
jgi:hypothetical protein